MRAVDLFAGPGGWDVAARRLGIDTVGVEFDHAACETRRAAGLETVEGDVREHGPQDGFDGLIASPPCQPFSSTGGLPARDAVGLLVGMIRGDLAGVRFPDPRTELVLTPWYWVLDAVEPYRWIALEQVPAVLPVWNAMADGLRGRGYSVATGILNAEQYGVPQTRRRAVLIASRDRSISLPTPTHSRYYPRDPSRLDAGVKPWVSMAEAVGRLDGMRSNYGTRGVATDRGERSADLPAPTITGKINRNKWTSGENVSIEEAAVLQTFPADYPWRGLKNERCQQIGNAIPPLLAEALLSELVL